MMEPELHVVLGMDPDEYDQALEDGRRTHNWAGLPAYKDPRWHAHPLLGITGHAHSSVEDARRYHGHKPELAWNHEPVFVARGDLMAQAERALNPVAVRAAMARGGIAPMQLQPWWSPDTDRQVRPLNDPEIQSEVWKFMGWLWGQCLAAEAPAVERAGEGGTE